VGLGFRVWWIWIPFRVSQKIENLPFPYRRREEAERETKKEKRADYAIRISVANAINTHTRFNFKPQNRIKCFRSHKRYGFVSRFNVRACEETDGFSHYAAVIFRISVFRFFFPLSSRALSPVCWCRILYTGERERETNETFSQDLRRTQRREQRAFCVRARKRFRLFSRDKGERERALSSRDSMR